MQKPKTLQQAIVHFANPDNCLKFMVARRWPDGVTCPTCGSKEIRFLETRRLWECKAAHARKQFSAKVGTIFEDSALGLDKWLVAVWMITNCKNGVSSYEVARAIGVTQKSAWFMLHRIRLAMQTIAWRQLGGNRAVEADETFMGGRAKFMHKDKHERRINSTGSKDKTAVFGILERGGEVRAMVIPTRRKRQLQAEIIKHVKPNTFLSTDALMSYHGLNARYNHEVIDHAKGYVRGRVHTNGLENFWSLLKRTIRGTYVSVEPYHLAAYLDEQVFRYNNRKQPRGDAARFEQVTSQLFDKRLTYAQLTGKVGTTDFLPN